MTNLDAMKALYAAETGDAEAVAECTETSQVILALAGYIGLDDVIVQPEKASKTLYGATVSSMQSNIVVADGAITGTLKFIAGGLAQSGPLAGDGNFMALKFIDENEADEIKVGLAPSAGTGLVALDSDMNAVFKVAGELDGVQQVLKVVTTKGGVTKTQSFDLTGLTLNTEA